MPFGSDESTVDHEHKATKKEVVIQLSNDQLLLILSNLDQRYKSSIEALLAPTDKLGTLLRWVAVIQEFVLSKPISPGLAIEFMSAHPAAAIPFLILCVVAGGANLALELYTQDEDNEKKKEFLKKLLAKIDIKSFNEMLKEILAKDSTLSKYQSLSISEEASDDKSTQQGIELSSIGATDSKHEENVEQPLLPSSATTKLNMRFAFKPEAIPTLPENPNGLDLIIYYFWYKFCVEIAWNKFLKPIWESGIIVGVAFWGLWILAGVFTGIHTEAIFGLNTIAALTLTGALALPYLGIRVYNYFKHGKKGESFSEYDEHARLMHEAEMDLKNIITQLHKKMQYQNELAQVQTLEEQLIQKNKAKRVILPEEKKSDQPISIRASNSLSDNPYLSAATGFATGTMANWGQSQQHAWWVKVFIQAITGTGLVMSMWNPIAGGILIAIGVGFGVANMIKRYRASHSANALSSNDPNAITLEEVEAHLNRRLQYLEQLRQQISQIPENILARDLIPVSLLLPPEPQTFTEKIKAFFIGLGNAIRNNAWIDAWDWSMTGFTFSRLIFTTAAIFIPFAALASNPFTLGIAITIAGIYVLMKWHEKKQIKKETRMKEYPTELEAGENLIALGERLLMVAQINTMHADHRSSPSGSTNKAYKLLGIAPPVIEAIPTNNLIGEFPVAEVLDWKQQKAAEQPTTTLPPPMADAS